jgi:hypothetical protein
MGFTSFWAKVKSFFKKVLSHAPTVIEDAQLAVAGLAPIVEAVDPAGAPLVAAGAKIVVDGLDELQTLVTQYESAPGTGTLANLQAGFKTVVSNLPGILAGAQVKDQATIAKVTTILDTVEAELTVLESSILAVHPAPTS